ncbi:hypothetical protein EDB83DRAFT_2579844 [Lactarius deliciosus]|nr:hypothetical protein EDB83DRAFT_2579844 [Lactarius deliciosus]
MYTATIFQMTDAYFVFVLETAQTALTGADVYYWFVAGFGNVERLGNSHFAPIDVSIITELIAIIVQGYFCYRIWCAVTQAVATTWLGVTGSTIHISTETSYLTQRLVAQGWEIRRSIPSALAGILIAVAMTLMLRRASSNFFRIVIIRAVRLTIETTPLLVQYLSLRKPHTDVHQTSCVAALAITAFVLYAAFPVLLICLRAPSRLMWQTKN